MKSIVLSKSERILKGVIHLPASKSISNRLLIINQLCKADLNIRQLSQADDTLLLQRLLSMIPAAGQKNKVYELDTANAGTVMRFLTAYLSVLPGKWMLTGSDRMKQRPIAILVDALISLGAKIDYLAKPGYPPLLITGGGLTGSEVTIDPGVSSQYTSALMMIAPCLPHGLRIKFKGKSVSSPYVEMTLQLMKQCKINATFGSKGIQIKPGRYVPADFDVESDWSAAAFWYEAAVFAHEVDLVLLGLNPDSLQGDSILPTLFRNFGIQTEFLPEGLRLSKVAKKIDGFYYNFTDHPDLAQAVIATCAGLGIRGMFEGVKSLQIKETDRLRAMKSEIEKMGFKAVVSAKSDEVSSFELKPVKPLFSAGLVFETYGDHRMAMALAPLAMIAGTIKIRNPEVVVKSYPEFWEQIKSVGFTIQM